MLEEVVDAFLFHQARGKVEIGLAVLHTVFAGFVSAVKLKIGGKTRQHRLEDAQGIALLLKDAALHIAG